MSDYTLTSKLLRTNIAGAAPTSIQTPIVAPRSIDTAQLADVWDEVVGLDIYELETTSPRTWCDVGCHIGLFTIKAMSQGHWAGMVIDSDEASLTCAKTNVEMADRVLRMEDDPEWLDYHATGERCKQVYGVHGANWLAKGVLLDSNAALKLDIQGAEADVLSGEGAGEICDRYPLLVMEWHDVDEWPQMSAHLYAAGYDRIRVKGHRDVLLGIDTLIVHAETGAIR